MSELQASLFDNLQTFFGYDTFKGRQEAIITNILKGRNTFVVMPTGGGKSMCYQLPALMNQGTAIVISPLIALMKNQVDQLRGFGSTDSIAHFLNSSLSRADMIRVKEDVLKGETKLLYVAPEYLAKESNLDFLKQVKVSFVAVDEAHCISEWGHDFRPEYRKIKSSITALGDNIPIISLTATATPKVQQDILKNLQKVDADVFKSSFNRPNLFYEVRPKRNAIKQIIKYIREHPGKSGIVYALSRKSVEKIAETLAVNGIKALPYHAGLDGGMRARHQDMFLMEEADVIVATIAFGMGIDKPDVRFVIHYDVPKSLESYYQETGRAGRDGGEGVCIAFYAEKDLKKLANFLKDKHVNEREIGLQLLQEVADYCESAVCRRKQVLHYFGEQFDEVSCNEMCDNCKNPSQKFEAQDDLELVLKVVKATQEQWPTPALIEVLQGESTKQIRLHKHDKIDLFGAGKEQEINHWEAVIRQSIIFGYLSKDIEEYGVLKLTPKGKEFLKSPEPVQFSKKVIYAEGDEDLDEARQSGGGALDNQLFVLLKDLRRKLAKDRNLPPYVIFQDPSLEEMASTFPISLDELKRISGVGQGKAMRYGKPFVELISKYVEENQIDRPEDLLVRGTANKSTLKVYIISSVDRRIPVNDIARSKGLDMDEMLKEMESIVDSGTRLNIKYYLDAIIDPDRQEDALMFFRESETGSVEEALEELGEDDYTQEELRLLRIQFLTEHAH